MRKYAKKMKLILIIALSLVLLFSGTKIVKYGYEGLSNKKSNAQLQETYHQAKAAGKTDKPKKYSEKFKELIKINSDLVGWIHLPNTSIDYPVVQTVDNDYYLTHSFEKEESDHGAIYMDYRNIQDSQKMVHTIIYGHYMKDGTMFKSLNNYKTEDYAKQNPYIEFDTLEGPTKWQIFSVYVIRAKNSTLQESFSNEEEYAQYLTMITEKSMENIGVEVTIEDQLLTLVTCSYELKDSRLIIHAKKIEN